MPLSEMPRLANRLDVLFENYTVDKMNCCKHKSLTIHACQLAFNLSMIVEDVISEVKMVNFFFFFPYSTIFEPLTLGIATNSANHLF